MRITSHGAYSNHPAEHEGVRTIGGTGRRSGGVISPRCPTEDEITAVAAGACG